MAEPIYAVGDLHGRLDEFERVTGLIEQDGGAQAQVVFLGDYVDRGPDSRSVIQGLIDGLAAGRHWTALKGNHDRMFEWFMDHQPRQDPHLLVGYHWFHDRLGGMETMASYGVDIGDRERLISVHARAKSAVPDAHIAFLRDLTLYHETAHHIFVHAGLRPGVPLERQDEEDLVWIRDEFHRHAQSFGRLVVHGHTPVKAAAHYGNRVNLDTGAGYGHAASVAVFEADECWLLTDVGRVALTPGPARQD